MAKLCFKTFLPEPFAPLKAPQENLEENQGGKGVRRKETFYRSIFLGKGKYFLLSCLAQTVLEGIFLDYVT